MAFVIIIEFISSYCQATVRHMALLIFLIHVDMLFNPKTCNTGRLRAINPNQWRNVKGLAEMSPLGSNKSPPMAPLAHELTESNL